MDGALELLIAPAVMVGIGLFFGIILAVSYRFLRVQEDPRIEATHEMLPGTNCGACGEPGCLPFAEKLVAGELTPVKCTVSSPDAIDLIADYLQVDAGAQEKLVSRLRCAGGNREAHQIAEYTGFDSCRAAAVVSGGGKGCSWGCLGLGDCEVACTFDVIHMNDNGLPVVNTGNCVACPDCVDACPLDLLELVPISQNLFVQCNSPLAGEAATNLCSVACDACGKCALDAAPDLIRMENNLPVIDYAAGGTPRPDAIFRCATNSIKWLVDDQFPEPNSARAAGGRR